ncbi:hypothetical protein ACFV0W_27360 [Streptomyces anulatus]
MQRASHHRSRSRRGLAAAVAAGALTVSMLGSGGPASADPSPDRALVEKMATTL